MEFYRKQDCRNTTPMWIYIYIPFVMVNFTYQLGWAMVPRNIINVILDDSVREFWDEINIYISGLWVKQIVLHNRVCLIQSVEELKRTKE